MNFIVFCTYREKDRVYRTFCDLTRQNGIVLLTTAATLEEDIKKFERSTVPAVLIVMRSLISLGFSIRPEVKTEILFSAEFPGGAERVQALGRLRDKEAMQRIKAMSHA